MTDPQSKENQLTWRDWGWIYAYEWRCRLKGAWLSLKGNYPYDACG